MFTIHKIGGKVGQQQWGVFTPDNVLAAVVATEDEANKVRQELEKAWMERNRDDNN